MSNSDSVAKKFHLCISNFFCNAVSCMNCALIYAVINHAIIYLHFLTNCSSTQAPIITINLCKLCKLINVMGIKRHDEQNNKKSIPFTQHYHKGPSKNYVTERGGEGSTILLHIVTLMLRVRGGYFTKLLRNGICKI